MQNKFGCICDKCGHYTKNKKEFFRLILPTYESKINNSTQQLDYCFKCYYDLKQFLKKDYNIKWEDD